MNSRKNKILVLLGFWWLFIALLMPFANGTINQKIQAIIIFSFLSIIHFLLSKKYFKFYIGNFPQQIKTNFKSLQCRFSKRKKRNYETQQVNSYIKCPYCYKYNNKKNIYCINCGKKISLPTSPNSIYENLETKNRFKGKFLYDSFVNLYMDMEENFLVEAEYYNNNVCPNCGMVDAKGFNTTKNCKGCKTKIIKRSNWLTKQGYLFGTSERLELFNEYNHTLSNLQFYEEKLQSLARYEENLHLLIFKFGCSSTTVSPKDLVWNICNYLSNDYNHRGLQLLDKIIKGNHEIELVNKAHIYFFKDSICQYLKFEIMEYEKDFCMANAIISQYTYCFIYSELILIKYNKFNLNDFDSLIKTDKLNFLKNYLTKYNISFEDFRKTFMAHVTCYHISIISKEDCLKIIKKILYKKD